MEILSIRLKTNKSTWLELYNAYLPNTSTQHNFFDASLIKSSLSLLILDNFNDHFQMWDPLQPQDERGDHFLDWILDSDLHILSDCSVTRTNRITESDSTPDISLCGSNWAAKISWRLAESIGSSSYSYLCCKNPRRKNKT